MRRITLKTWLLVAAMMCGTTGAWALEIDESAKTVTIATADDLADFSAKVYTSDSEKEQFKDYTVTVTADIDMSTLSSGKTFEPIGKHAASALYTFCGTFDGGGHTISNLTISKTSETNVGLFTYTNGIIKNLRLDASCSITGLYNVGGIVGYIDGNVSGTTSIQNCTSAAAVKGTESVGGIAGRMCSANSYGKKVAIIGCTNSGTVTTTSSCGGGIVGQIEGYDATQEASVTECVNSGTVEYVSGYNIYSLGGIVGSALSGAVRIKNCVNSGNVTAAYNVSGILGNAASGANVNLTGNIASAGTYTVKQSTGNVGAIVGQTTSQVTLTNNYYYQGVKVVNESAGNTYDGTTPRGLGQGSAAPVDATAAEGAVCQVALTGKSVDATNYYTSYYNSIVDVQLDANTKAYKATAIDAVGSKLTLTAVEGNKVPKGTAVVLKSTAESITLDAIADAATTVTSELKGVDESTDKSTLGSGTFYVLSGSGSNVGFYQYSGANIPAHKAYALVAGGGSARLFFDFDGETTGVMAVDNSPLTSGNYYDLQGRRVATLGKGIYIVNTKKVINQ